MKQVILIVLALSLMIATGCKNREIVKYETITIERVDTVVVVAPPAFRAVFDSITETPQTRIVDGGRVVIKRVVDKVYVDCVPDTIVRTVQMERIVREKGKTITVDRPSRWLLWLIIGAACVIGAQVVWRMLLRGL